MPTVYVITFEERDWVDDDYDELIGVKVVGVYMHIIDAANFCGTHPGHTINPTTLHKSV